jgi:hypothetical protein
MKRTVITLFEEDLNVHGVETMKQYGPSCLGGPDFKNDSVSLTDIHNAEIVRYIHMHEGRIIGCYILKDRYLSCDNPVMFTVRERLK